MQYAAISFALELPTQMNRRILRPLPKIAALVTATLAVTAIACGDLTGVPASLQTISDSGLVYAINGAPPNAPTSLHFYSGQRLAADANFFFDVAFDIDGAGNVVILPQRAVASGLAATHSVGLQKSDSSFASIELAPRSGYRADTSLVTTAGVVVLAQSNDANVCSFSLTGSTIYAKLVVTSVDRLARTLNIRYTVDPNCGFRSFKPGVPKD